MYIILKIHEVIINKGKENNIIIQYNVVYVHIICMQIK